MLAKILVRSVILFLGLTGGPMKLGVSLHGIKASVNLVNLC